MLAQIGVRRGNARILADSQRLPVGLSVDGEFQRVLARQHERTYGLLARRVAWNGVIGQCVFRVLQKLAAVGIGQGFWRCDAQIPNEAIQSGFGR